VAQSIVFLQKSQDACEYIMLIEPTVAVEINKLRIYHDAPHPSFYLYGKMMKLNLCQIVFH
jgi:hypothetical protein